MTTLTPPTFLGNEVRIIVADGEPLFVLNDLCAVLGLTRRASQISDRLDDDVRLTYPIVDGLGRTQPTTVVTEAGMYDVILRSESENAKPLRRWITTEVLPSIRRTGTYTVPSASATAKAVTAGRPMRSLPDRANPGLYQPAKHWQAVAAACREHPGMWRPITIEGFTEATYRGSVAPIRDGVLYVRCLPDADELLRTANAPAIKEARIDEGELRRTLRVLTERSGS